MEVEVFQRGDVNQPQNWPMFTSLTETNQNPAKKTKQDSDQSRDDVIPTKNAFAGLAIDEPEIVVTDKTAQVADLPQN
ncbi:hypothetical protein TNCV_189081 [Trichonephila clavipes]|nr:hypothetical protein TNCV_189081 [Trichonephila clavipes]